MGCEIKLKVHLSEFIGETFSPIPLAKLSFSPPDRSEEKFEMEISDFRVLYSSNGYYVLSKEGKKKADEFELSGSVSKKMLQLEKYNKWSTRRLLDYVYLNYQEGKYLEWNPSEALIARFREFVDRTAESVSNLF